jgi:hypothetical protein
MRKEPKLGRLVVIEQQQKIRAKAAAQRGGAPPEPAPRVPRIKLVLAITGWLCVAALAATAGVLWASGWLPAQLKPRKLIVRGCVLTKPEDVLLKLDCTTHVSYVQLVQQARTLDLSSERWLQGVRAGTLLPRTALLTVQERQPVLRAIVGGAKYWLCSDGTLAAMDVKADHGAAYDRIRQLPSIELHSMRNEEHPVDHNALLIAAACCEQQLPGIMDRIVQGSDGMLNLYDRSGFQVYLGEATELETKIGALPKALRVCAADKLKLKYLDASNARIFYQVWKEPLSAAPGANASQG